jgi:hypothetical protein
MAGCSFTINGSLQSFAKCVYVDYVGGSDINGGTSPADAYKTAPGMAGHDIAEPVNTAVILKGGVTWPMDVIGCWTWTGNQHAGSGTPSTPDYLGAGDQTWFTGGAWTRPILSGSGTNNGLNPVTACPNIPSIPFHNVFMAVFNKYTIVDNLEFTGAVWGYAASIGNCTFGGGNSCDMYLTIGSSADPGFIVQNCYAHGTKMATGLTECQTAGCNPGDFAVSSTTGPASMTGQFNVADGADDALVLADPNCTGLCTTSFGRMFGGGWSDLYYNLGRYMDGAIDGSFQNVGNNLVEYARISNNTNSGAHANTIQFDNALNGCLVYNNVVRHFNDLNGVNIKGVQGFSIGNAGGTTCYIWNNLVYDPGPQNQWSWGYSLACFTPTNGCKPAGTQYIFNNTAISPTLANAGTNCQFYTSCHIDNTHYITDGATQVNNCTPAVNCFDGGHNLFQSTVVGTNQGYTAAETNPYSPTPGGSTIGYGANYQAYCTAIAAINAKAGAACLKDTTLGVGYNTSNHTVIIPFRTPQNVRPSVGVWDAGAYQFTSGGGPVFDAFTGTASMVLNLNSPWRISRY